MFYNVSRMVTINKCKFFLTKLICRYFLFIRYINFRPRIGKIMQVFHCALIFCFLNCFMINYAVGHNPQVVLKLMMCMQYLMIDESSRDVACCQLLQPFPVTSFELSGPISRL